MARKKKLGVNGTVSQSTHLIEYTDFNQLTTAIQDKAKAKKQKIETTLNSWFNMVRPWSTQG
jgi:DNA phosphorothioation-dependent restriction protein DptG